VSYSIDVNLLLYGSDTSSHFHSRARAFLEACAGNDEPLYLCYPTLMGYVRMSTHPRIFTNPLTPGEAFANVETLATLPQVRLVSEREGFLDVYKEVTNEVVVRANLVPDAHLLSILMQHGVSTLYTANVDDFRKLGCSDPRNPLA
jgi:toxin-antitoxin system PIN domain toxin